MINKLFINEFFKKPIKKIGKNSIKTLSVILNINENVRGRNWMKESRNLLVNGLLSIFSR